MLEFLHLVGHARLANGTSHILLNALTTARAALAISAEKSQLPEQKSIDARAAGDIISEHTSIARAALLIDLIALSPRRSPKSVIERYQGIALLNPYKPMQAQRLINTRWLIDLRVNQRVNDNGDGG